MRYEAKDKKEIIEGIHNQPAEENFSKSIRKWKLHKFDRTHNKIGCHKSRRYLTHLSIPEIEMLNKEPHNKMMEAVTDTTEHMILEESWYKTEETYITRKKVVIYTKVIRTTNAEEMMDYG